MKKDLVTLIVLVGILVLAGYLLSLRQLPTSSSIEILPPTTESSATEELNVSTEPSETTITTKTNKPATALGVTIAPIEVVEDSRCPVDENIQCIQAGTVRVRTKVAHPNGERILIFTIGTPIASKTELIELVDVLPSPRAEVPIVMNEYRFIFKITQVKN